MLDEISRGIKKARLSERAFVWSVADAAMQVVTCDTTEQGEQDSVDQAQACDCLLYTSLLLCVGVRRDAADKISVQDDRR